MSASEAAAALTEVPATIYHLAQKADWDAAIAEERDYYTDSLEKEGITHASASLDIILDIANSFYTGVSGEFVLLHVKTEALKSEVKLVQADAPLPASSSSIAPKCPHIFGPILREAVIKITAVTRDPSGAFLRIE